MTADVHLTPRPVYLTVRDAAHLSRIPVRTIQRWVLNGWLTDHGDGLVLLVEYGQVQELLDRRPGKRLQTAGL